MTPPPRPGDADASARRDPARRGDAAPPPSDVGEGPVPDAGPPLGDAAERRRARDRFAQGERLDLKEWRSGSGKVLGVEIPEPRGGHLSVAVPPGVPGVEAERAPAPGEVSDRVWTIPNVISMGRIALIPVFALCVATWARPGLALVLLAVLGASDWLDGKIARLFDMRSKLGAKLDPIADRILITVVPLVFAFGGLVPWWIVWVLLARDAVLVGTLPVYRRRGGVPEVIYLGKAASFALMWSFPLLLAAAADVWFAEELRLAGEASLYWGIGLYLWSGLVYLARAVQVARRVPPGGSISAAAHRS